MIEKYINFFKKSLIVLAILLLVISFSFGHTYSNFIYSSDSYRAVEMFTSKLKYEISNEVLKVKPGNNIFKINIKSLNDIDTFFKVVYENNNVNVRFFNYDKKIINANKSTSVNLLVYNKSDDDIDLKIDVIGGYKTNKYEDIKVSEGYKEVKENIEIGKTITLNTHNYKLLNVNSDGSYELLSSILEDRLNIEGSNGYNQYINIISDNINAIEGSFSKKVLSIEDIEKYTKNKIVEYDSPNHFDDAYYPVLWSNENGSIINDTLQEGFYSKSEGVSNGNYEHANSILLKDIKINTIEFINNKYNEVFMDSNYLIATRYQKANMNTATWGVLSMEDGNIKLNELFESNLKNYSVNGNIRILINITNGIDLFN